MKVGQTVEVFEWLLAIFVNIHICTKYRHGLGSRSKFQRHGCVGINNLFRHQSNLMMPLKLCRIKSTGHSKGKSILSGVFPHFLRSVHSFLFFCVSPVIHNLLFTFLSSSYTFCQSFTLFLSSVFFYILV